MQSPRRRGDRDLLDAYFAGPDSYEGKMALEELRFRNHLAFMRYNRWLIGLTIVLALSALVDVAAGLAGSRSQQSCQCAHVDSGSSFMKK